MSMIFSLSYFESKQLTETGTENDGQAIDQQPLNAHLEQVPSGDEPLDLIRVGQVAVGEQGRREEVRLDARALVHHTAVLEGGERSE